MELKKINLIIIETIIEIINEEKIKIKEIEKKIRNRCGLLIINIEEEEIIEIILIMKKLKLIKIKEEEISTQIKSEEVYEKIIQYNKKDEEINKIQDKLINERVLFSSRKYKIKEEKKARKKNPRLF